MCIIVAHVLSVASSFILYCPIDLPLIILLLLVSNGLLCRVYFPLSCSSCSRWFFVVKCLLLERLEIYTSFINLVQDVCVFDEFFPLA